MKVIGNSTKDVATAPRHGKTEASTLATGTTMISRDRATTHGVTVKHTKVISKRVDSKAQVPTTTLMAPHIPDRLTMTFLMGLVSTSGRMVKNLREPTGMAAKTVRVRSPCPTASNTKEIITRISSMATVFTLGRMVLATKVITTKISSLAPANISLGMVTPTKATTKTISSVDMVFSRAPMAEGTKANSKTINSKVTAR